MNTIRASIWGTGSADSSVVDRSIERKSQFLTEAIGDRPCSIRCVEDIHIQNVTVPSLPELILLLLLKLLISDMKHQVHAAFASCRRIVDVENL